MGSGKYCQVKIAAERLFMFSEYKGDVWRGC